MTATDTRFAALLAAIDADPTNPEPVAILGDWFEDQGNEWGSVRAGCIQWAVKWGRMPICSKIRGHWFVPGDCTEHYHVPARFRKSQFFIPEHDTFRASEAWLALCDRWAEMTADEREMDERESERVWGGK